jgi:ABC-type sugar transport system substrate-binding protein
MAQGIDVLGLLPYEGGAILPTVQAAFDQGIAVFFTQDTAPGAVEDGIAVTYIAADEVEGGRLVGEWFVEESGGTGSVALVEGASGDSAAVDRTQGFNEAIEGTDVQIVAQDTANWVRDEGLRVGTDILTANPDLNAIFAHNDEMAFGVLEALRAAGREDSVILMSYNGTCIGNEATINGDFDVEGVLFTDQIGQIFIQEAVAYMAGEDVEPRIVTPVLAIDTEEMNAILNGEADADPVLVERLENAAAGNC